MQVITRLRGVPRHGNQMSSALTGRRSAKHTAVNIYKTRACARAILIMRSDLALTPSEGVGIGERYFPEKPKIEPGVIRQGKIPTWGIG